MSPHWREQIAIYFSPRRLAVVRRGRGPWARASAATELAVPAGGDDDLGPVLARLSSVLAERTWRGAAARVVVSDRPWARYGVVPWSETRLDAAGRLARARYVLGAVHGDAVADWAVTVADAPPGQGCVACAMPATLRAALEETLAPAGISLVSLQPRLVVDFNAWRHRLPAEDSWFVSVEVGFLAAVHLKDGAWDRVHMARLSPDWQVELERLLAFSRLTRAAGGPSRMFVAAPAWMRSGAGPCPGIEWLGEGGGEATAPELAMLGRLST